MKTPLYSSVQLDKSNIEDIMELTPMQSGMLFHYLESLSRYLYVEQLSLRLAGKLDRSTFDQAWNFVVRQNEMLRVTFRWQDLKKPVQIILKETALPLRYYDISDKPAQRQETLLAAIKKRDRDRGFDLQSVPFRLILFKTADSRYEMIVSSHHILYDGWSGSIILSEFFSAYEDLRRGDRPGMVPRTRFKDFIQWLQKRDRLSQKRFWHDYFRDCIGPTELALKKRRRGEGEESLSSGCFPTLFPDDLTAKIEACLRQLQITPAALFYAAWGLLLQRYNHSVQAMFGTTVSGRSAPIKGIERMVGLFINSVPLWLEERSGETAAELLSRLNESLRLRQAYEHTPLTDIIDYAGFGSSTTAGELFDTLLVMENYPLTYKGREYEGGLTVLDGSMVEMTHYDLTVNVMQLDNQIEVKFIFLKEILWKGTIEGLSRHFQIIMTELVDHPGKEVRQIDMLSNSDREQVMIEFNSTRSEYDSEKSIQKLFIDQAMRIPGSIAVVGAHLYAETGKNPVQLAYGELLKRAQAQALQLLQKGIRPDSIVGIIMERSVQMMEWFYAVWLAGGAYLPLDSQFPDHRIRYMLADSRAEVLITAGNIKDMENRQAGADHYSPSPLAYVIYTSGSTGRPKGVLIEHRPVLNLFRGIVEVIDFSPGKTFLALTTISFDIFVLETLLPLTCGLKVVIADREQRSEISRLAAIIVRERIDMIQATPTFMKLIVSVHCDFHCLQRLKEILVGGETFPGDLLKDLKKMSPARIFNMYGPTETTVWSTVSELSGDRDIDVGQPIANTQVYIVSRNGLVQPVGAWGELYIGGDGLASGYINSPELTADRFVCASSDLAMRLYRTGDLACWQPDGNIRFLGRLDQQVKIRGFRIELGEIEHRLRAHPMIDEAVVLDWPDMRGDKVLVAYIVVDSGPGPDTEQFREYLATALPDYMIPASFQRLEKIPLLPSGKIDRQALPEPVFKSETLYTPPANSIEARLEKIWREVLGGEERIGALDNFFTLGGHSLTAMALSGRINREFSVEFPLRLIFRNPSIRTCAEFVRQARQEDANPVLPGEKREYYPLSSAQRRLFFLYRIEPVGIAYNIPGVFRCRGKLIGQRLETAFQSILARHEVLRSVFSFVDNVPVQLVKESAPFKIEYYDPPEEPYHSFIRDFIRPFDLTRPPLLRVGLAFISPERALLLFDVHHIAADGISLNIMAAELTQLLADRSLPPLKVQYRDFSAWEQRQIDSGETRSRQRYWLKRFEDDLPRLNLAADYPRPAVMDFRGERYPFSMPTAYIAPFKRLASVHNATYYMNILTAFFVLMYKYTGQHDIIIGSVIAGRSGEEVRDLIGMFVNTLPIRCQPWGSKTYSEFLQEVKTVNSEAYENQDLPFEALVEGLNPQRDPSRNPLFDVCIAVEEGLLVQGNWHDIAYRSLKYDRRNARFDLTLFSTRTEDTVDFSFEYYTGIFKGETIRKMAGHFLNIIRQSCENPDIFLADIDILTPEEKYQLLIDLNDTVTPYPRENTIHRLFEEQAERSSGGTALVLGEECMTYGEVDSQSTRMAAGLQQQSRIRTNEVIGILMHRSMHQIIAILGILKTGAAYVPMDPTLPVERIRYIRADSGADILVTAAFMTALRDGENIPPLLSGDVPNVGSLLAYVIYTSGSTGRAKGTLINHHNVVRVVKNTNYIDFTVRDRVLQLSNYAFDGSVFDIYGALLNGSALVLLKNEDILDLVRLADQILNRCISIFFITTALFNAMVDFHIRCLGNIRKVLFGGEKVSPTHARRALAYLGRDKIIHVYGPTESTVYASFYCLDEVDDRMSTVPIGRPLANTTVYLLDGDFQPVPYGGVGELYIGGDGLARGYLNNPDLTAEKFIDGGNRVVHHRLLPDPEILYRTGDRVRFLEGGQLDFVGRLDNQVKVRGFRVEPAEIKARLLSHEQVRDAEVVTGRESSGVTCLCAYVVPGSRLSSPTSYWKELRNHLSLILPEYMIPSHFVQVDHIPLTVNGKVDFKALPPPESSHRREAGTFPGPRTVMEMVVADIWKEVLQLDEVGLDDNFFDLGGHSLTIIQVHHQLNDKLHRDLPVTALFRFPTVRSLSRFLEPLGEGREPSADSPAVPAESPVVRNKNGYAAVIGMAGRFPGAVDIDEFWDNLKRGLESISFFSRQELLDEGVDSRLLNRPEYVGANGMLTGIDYFDAFFFNYTPVEADIMDPQMRVLHECAWNALEDAGYIPDHYDGAIGLYAGVSPHFDWLTIVRASGRAADLDRFAAWQLVDRDFTCLRISYKLNLRGPAVMVQTACSTSLVAIHTAYRALIDEECTLALAGGADITLLHKSGYLYLEGMILSADGHCRPFDAAASGTVTGSGAGLVVLKPLLQAEADGDHIYSVVKGSAVNNDGTRKVGFTAPSVEGQAEVIRAACAMARFEPESITYVEAHGTGTRLGDPVEIEALRLALATECRVHTAVGSVKSNIGHLNFAAGVAGFIKTTLALYHRLIPPSLHFDTPNPEIDFSGTPLYINTRLRKWKNAAFPLRAGVSSFGIGGTNVHLVMEAYIPSVSETVAISGSKYQLILMSAKKEMLLEPMAAALAGYFQSNPHLDLADAAYTLQVGRKSFPCRRMLLGCSVNEVADGLRSPTLDSVLEGKVRRDNPPVVFMFPGQGAQYVNMGADLYEKEPVFREELDRCFNLLEPLLDFDMKSLLYPGSRPFSSHEQDRCGNVRTADADKDRSMPPAAVNRTEIAQPLLFSFQYALARTVVRWGIRPHAMIGHSLGEYVAACLSGVFSLEDALRAVVSRGRLVQQLPGGAMLSVPLSEAELESLLKTHTGVSLAAVNSSRLCTLSGTGRAVRSLDRQLRHLGIRTGKLHTSHAFHSPMMEPLLSEFSTMMAVVPTRPPVIPFISNLTGSWISPADTADAGYWARQLQQTVRFGDGLRTLFNRDYAVFVEVGGGGLTTFVRQHADRKPNHSVLHLIRHPSTESPDDRFLRFQVGRLWLLGVAVDWRAFHTPQRRRRISLPTYPFEHCRCWLGKPSRATGTSEAYGKDLTGRFYIPRWKHSPPIHLPGPESGVTTSNYFKGSGRWLVFGHRQGLTKRLVKELKEEAQEVILVYPGARFSTERNTDYTIDIRQRKDYERLFKGINGAPDHILHLWSLNPRHTGRLDHPKPFTRQRFEEAQHYGLYSLLHLASVLRRPATLKECRLIVIADGLHQVGGDEDISPRKATLMAPLKVIPREFPYISCRCIDVVLPEPRSPGESLLTSRLMAELRPENREPVSALRGPIRWLPEYESLTMEELPDGNGWIRDQGVYLITGGLGEMGLAMAGYLAREHRAQLVLTGRTRLPPRNKWSRWLTASPHDTQDTIGSKIRRVLELEESGARLLVFSANAADRSRMAAVLAKTRALFGRINGVIHAAGVTHRQLFQPLDETTPHLCLQHFRAKVYGLAVLTALLKDTPPDFWMVTSSLASILGGPGFTAYASANLFMDAFVRSQNRQGGSPWITVNWDAWRFDRRETYAGPALSTEEGIKVFRQIVTGPVYPQLAVSAGDLEPRIDRWLAGEARHDEGETGDRLQQRPDIDTGFVVPATELERVLAGIFQDFLGIDQVGIYDDFFELGGDSLKVVSLLGKVHQEIRIDIPVKEFFNRPTVHKLARFIENSGRQSFIPLKPSEEAEYYRLSYAQLRLYLLQHMQPATTAYNLVTALHITGDIDKKRLEKAFRTLIRRQEIFRTSFETIGGEPVQRVHGEVTFGVEFHCRKGAGQRPELRLVRPFDLATPPLLRVGLFEQAVGEHLLMLVVHHLTADGITLARLIDEFTALYGGKELPPQKIRYRDYARWQVSRGAVERLKRQETFWLQQLSGELPVLTLPLDFPRPDVQSLAGRTISFEIDKEASRALEKVARFEGVSLFVLLLTLLSVLLYKLSRQTDVLVGTQVAGRRHPEVRNLMGVFINSLVLRCRPHGEKTFRGFLKETMAGTLGAFDNQEYPLESLLEKIPGSRRAGRNPLFDVMLVWQNFDISKLRIPGLAIEYNRREIKENALVDLTFYGSHEGDRILFRLEYNTDLFSQSTIERWIVYFNKIVSSVSADIDIKIQDILIHHDMERAGTGTFADEDGDFGFR